MRTDHANDMLRIDQLHVRYGGIEAVKGIHLTVGKGELVCLIGANGAGKSTTLKAITSLVPAASGRIFFNQEDITNCPAHELPRKGLVMVPEGRGVFSRMTILENLQMGAYARGGQTSSASAIQEDMDTQLDLFPRLKERLQQLAGNLSGGEQQMLAMARALMARPTMLIMDEPSMGLSPVMVEKIFEVIREVSGRGVTILLVEQNARLALQVSARGYVMDSGLITASAASADLLNDPAVRQAYLGE
jgi:branched-chain amino acid transport system ATP-binding protein